MPIKLFSIQLIQNHESSVLQRMEQELSTFLGDAKQIVSVSVSNDILLLHWEEKLYPVVASRVLTKVDVQTVAAGFRRMPLRSIPNILAHAAWYRLNRAGIRTFGDVLDAGEARLKELKIGPVAVKSLKDFFTRVEITLPS